MIGSIRPALNLMIPFKPQNPVVQITFNLAIAAYDCCGGIESSGINCLSLLSNLNQESRHGRVNLPTGAAVQREPIAANKDPI